MGQRCASKGTRLGLNARGRDHHDPGPFFDPTLVSGPTSGQFLRSDKVRRQRRHWP